MDWAKCLYINFLNQTRFHKHLAVAPNFTRILHPKTPTKWAILCVLTTKYWLTVNDIQDLLVGLSYRRSRSHIRKGLSRCLKFGLVINTTYTKNDVRWQMTEHGLQALNMPKTMKETMSEKVRREMSLATKWLAVSDLVTLITGAKAPTVARALRQEGASADVPGLVMLGGVTATYKFKKIPGDTYGRKQWALGAADTTGWADAAPKLRPMTVKTKKAKSASAGGAVVALNPRYQGFPMCLSATTAAKTTLLTAVGDLVTKEFLPAQKRFSAHDVTARLRGLVYDQAKEMDDKCQTTGTRQTYVPLVDSAQTGKVYVKGLEVAKVEHEDVKEIVHELFNSGAMAGYDRVHNGKYFEYDLVANIQPVLPQATVVSAPATTPADPTTATPAGTAGSTYDGSSTI